MTNEERGYIRSLIGDQKLSDEVVDLLSAQTGLEFAETHAFLQWWFHNEQQVNDIRNFFVLYSFRAKGARPTLFLIRFCFFFILKIKFTMVHYIFVLLSDE